MLEEKNINLVLKEGNSDEKPLLTLRGLAQQTKRIFVLWLVCAVVLGLVSGCAALLLKEKQMRVQAAVEFTFSGVENGKDPAGNEFDAAKQLKSPVVLKNALDTLGYDANTLSVDDLRDNITVKSIIPEDAIDKLLAYKSVFDAGNSNALNAVQAMLNVSYHPTRYIISFDPTEVGVSGEEGTQVMNAVLDAYKQYFYETYGYNKALGTAVLAVDYHDYDYERAIEVFDNSLESAQRYVNTLANEDSTGFRSVATGYSFTDLANALGTLRSEDLGWISSYVTVNNVTKDRDMLLTNYEYRIENLKRQKTAAETNLASIEASIAAYQKDTVLIVGSDKNSSDITFSQASDQYDNMINRKLSTQAEIAECTKDIAYYEERVNELQMASNSATKAQMNYLDEQLDKLYNKITALLETVDATADEFYENVAFANAYSVTVPASISDSGSLSGVITLVLVLEVLLFVVFAMIIVCRAFVQQYRVNNPIAVAEAAEEAVPADEEKEQKSAKEKNGKKNA